jgi:hypothetical protein
MQRYLKHNTRINRRIFIMAFNPIIWKDGDTITADKLNGMVFNFSDTDIETGAALTQPEGTLVLDVKGDLYQSQAGKAVLLGSFVGPKGDAGDPGKAGSDAKQIKAGTLNEDKSGVLTGATLTFTDDTTLELTINKATA